MHFDGQNKNQEQINIKMTQYQFIMQTPLKPANLILKRRHTQNNSVTPRPATRGRVKTTYHEHSVSQIQEKQKPVSDSYSEYADLVVQSVKKNYMVGNLKPYANDKSVFRELKMEVSRLKQVQLSSNLNSFYNQKETIQGKFNKLIISALNFKKKTKKTRFNTNTKTIDSIFVKSGIEDDLENLIEDYRQESKLEKIGRQKTISNINKKIINNYSSFLEIETDNNQRPRNQKNHFVRFKKQQRGVIRAYSSNDQTLPFKNQQMNYNKILDLEKEDYGIYSRSANKALYYSKKKPIQTEENTQKVQNVVKMQKKFYRNYMGSYSQRKNILRRSEASIHTSSTEN